MIDYAGLLGFGVDCCGIVLGGSFRSTALGVLVLLLCGWVDSMFGWVCWIVWLTSLDVWGLLAVTMLTL